MVFPGQPILSPIPIPDKAGWTRTNNLFRYKRHILPIELRQLQRCTHSVYTNGKCQVGAAHSVLLQHACSNLQPSVYMGLQTGVQPDPNGAFL